MNKIYGVPFKIENRKSKIILAVFPVHICPKGNFPCLTVQRLDVEIGAFLAREQFDFIPQCISPRNSSVKLFSLCVW